MNVEDVLELVQEQLPIVVVVLLAGWLLCFCLVVSSYIMVSATPTHMCYGGWLATIIRSGERSRKRTSVLGFTHNNYNI